MSRRLSVAVWLNAAPEAVFDHLDDQTRLAAHIARSSAMMGESRMTYAFDAERGQAVGSHITMRGSAFRLRLYVDEVVTLRERPWSKRWETVGPTRLLILSAYHMGFDIAPAEEDAAYWSG